MLASVFTLLALITHLISVTVLYFTQPVKGSSVFTSSVSLTTHNSCWYICLYRASEEALLDASFSVHSACLDNPSDQCHCAVRYSAREGHCGSAP